MAITREGECTGLHWDSSLKSLAVWERTLCVTYGDSMKFKMVVIMLAHLKKKIMHRSSV